MTNGAKTLSVADARPVLIMAGGTGGHVFPALAVAKILRQRSIPVVWLGSAGGMETRLVPANGFELERVEVAGLRGKGAASWLRAPFKLIAAVNQARAIVKRVKPRVALGAGGFASGPGGIATNCRARCHQFAGVPNCSPPAAVARAR